MRGAALVLACLMLAGCETSTSVPDGTVLEIRPTLPAGYPPKIGDVRARLNGAAQHWQAYDYSIGALDSAAQIRKNGNAVEFRLLGVPAGKPMGDSNRLAIRGTMAGKLAVGATSDVVIEIFAGPDWDGLRLSSVGQAVELVLEEVRDQVDGGYGHATGRFSATLCAATGDPVVVDKSRCQVVEGTFDTEIQFENL
jgi:hypothetical protein